MEKKVKDIEELPIRDQLDLQRTIRLYKWATGNPTPPFKLVLTPTDRCNLNCMFCPNYTARQKGRFKKDDELSKDEWLNIVEQALELKVLLWCMLGGGEPLLRSDVLLPILETISEKSRLMNFELITNGILLNQQLIEGMMKVVEKKVEIDPNTHKKKELSVFQVTISAHGMKDTYKSLTQFDGFEKVLQNLKIIRGLKEKLCLEQPIVQMNIVVNKKNWEEVLELVKVFGELKVNQVALHPMRGFEETEDVIKSFELSDEQWKKVPELIMQVKKLAEKYNLHISTDPIDFHMKGPLHFSTSEEKIDDVHKENLSLQNLLKIRCYEPWYNMLINPDGSVSRCAAYSTRREPVSIRSNSLKEIWFGEFFEKVRKDVIKDIPMEGCRRCGLLSNTEIIKRDLENFLKDKIGVKRE